MEAAMLGSKRAKLSTTDSTEMTEYEHRLGHCALHMQESFGPLRMATIKPAVRGEKSVKIGYHVCHFLTQITDGENDELFAKRDITERSDMPLANSAINNIRIKLK